VLLAACDIRRPAAVDQLKISGRPGGGGDRDALPGETVPQIGARAMEHAIANKVDIVIFDTGGRFQIDAELVGELKELKDAVKPQQRGPGVGRRDRPGVGARRRDLPQGGGVDGA
jgi:signal recognition particle subunit SRP54